MVWYGKVVNCLLRQVKVRYGVVRFGDELPFEAGK